MSIIKGQKINLSSLIFKLNVSDINKNDLTHSIFVVGKDRKLIQDEYMVFYGNESSPENAIVLENDDIYSVNLEKLPSHADRVAFTIHIPVGSPESSNLSSLSDVTISFGDESLSFNGSQLSSEKALIVLEFYRYQDSWKAGATVQGFNGGLAKLVEYYGAEVSSPQDNQAVPVSAPVIVESAKSAPITISLAKQRIEKLEASNVDKIIINLAKQASGHLEKFDLDNHTADVVIILDFSASMTPAFNDGRVQSVAEQLVAAGALFDDNQSIDVYMFDSRVKYLGELTPINFKNQISKWEKQYGLGGGTDYAKPIQAVRDQFFNTKEESVGLFGRKAKALSEIPAERDKPIYAFFLTDGDATDKTQTTRLIKEVSRLPIFWQFVGIDTGWSSFDYLEKLDDLSDRFIDNADFFELGKGSIDQNALFSKMFQEYPNWIKIAKSKGLLKN